jgi:transposase
MNLMQAGAAQPASQKSVDVFRAEGKVQGAIRRNRALAASLGKEPSQRRQGFYARRSASLRLNSVHDFLIYVRYMFYLEKTQIRFESSRLSRISGLLIHNPLI